jgi:hypothetical protein
MQGETLGWVQQADTWSWWSGTPCVGENIL